MPLAENSLLLVPGWEIHDTLDQLAHVNQFLAVSPLGGFWCTHEPSERLLHLSYHWALCQVTKVPQGGMLDHNLDAFVCFNAGWQWFVGIFMIWLPCERNTFAPTPPDCQGLYRICMSELWFHSPNKSVWYFWHPWVGPPVVCGLSDR